MKYWDNDDRNESNFHPNFFKRLVGFNNIEEAKYL